MGESLLERVWQHREESLYPSLFGGVSRGIFVVPLDSFSTTFGQADIDPRWLHYGVFEFAPTPSRASWVYVTSGMSTPWDSVDGESDSTSGLGCEFLFESNVQGDWAVRRLWHLMAFQILLCHGRYPGRESLSVFDRVPLHSPISFDESAIQILMLAPAEEPLRTQQLESGEFWFLRVVGITDEEAAFARATDGARLLDELRGQGAFPVTNPKRMSIRLDMPT